ncbi:MAG: hypothetical protein E7496_09155 [Ruminococcus sp.]|nr:hypothetical protein [Ruminococcus sp.]
MADKKKSFILYLDRKKELDMLTDEQAGKLFKAVYQYAEDGKEPEFGELVLTVMFSVFRSQMDMNAEKYAEICKKRSENQHKRWEKQKEREALENHTSVYNCIQTSTNHTDNDNVNVNVNGNGNENVNGNEKENVNGNEKDNVNEKDNDIFYSGDTPEPPVFSPAPENNFLSSEQDFSQLVCNYTQNPQLQQALFDFIDYRKKGRRQFTPKALELNLQKLDELACYDTDKIAVLHQSVAFGWSGLFPLSQNPHYGRKQPVHDIIREQEKAEIQKYLDLLD